MDPSAAIQWCKEQKSNVGADTSEDTWTEEQICQAVTALIPDQKDFIKDAKKKNK